MSRGTVSQQLKETVITDPVADAELMRAVYDQHGFVVCKGLIDRDVDYYRQKLADMMGARLVHLGEDISDLNGDLDALFERSGELDEHSKFEIRTVARENMAFYKLITNPKVTDTVATLFGHDNIQVNVWVNLVRVDAPNRDQEAFHWHQDYPYNLMSRSAVTVWAPLTPITSDMGYLAVVPGSHRELHAVEIDKNELVPRYTHHQRMRMANYDALAESFEREALEIDCVEPGDVLFFHSQLVHRSGANRSDRSRWVFNFRLGDVVDQEVLERHWFTARPGKLYPIVDIHPDKAIMVDVESEAGPTPQDGPNTEPDTPELEPV